MRLSTTVQTSDASVSSEAAIAIEAVANTTLKAADSGNDDHGEPYFIVEIAEQTVSK